MLLQILFLIGGLAMILIGANILTDGSAALARRWGVSQLVVGLTIVAFGTSAPELVISVMSAAKGATELAIGNVVGSNIFNALAIIGIVAIVRPMRIATSTLAYELPLNLLAALALLAIGNATILDGAPASELSRVNAILLLLFFAIFMRYTFSQAQATPSEDDDQVEDKPMGLPRAIIMIILGLVLLIVGGNLFVDGASYLAGLLGVSQSIIGLTIVAIGTSLPELATSIVAATKGKSDLAVGNVIGSNIFNTFFVCGAAGVVRPLQFGTIGNLDLLILTLSALLFLIVSRWGGNRIITRAEGILLVIVYIAYTAALIHQA